jgi:hypothetical protein
MQNVIYQLMHPWHWLTYGQNATAVAAIAACLGLIGLYFYTRYTRTMMGVQQSIARASFTPILVADDVDFDGEDTRMVEVAPGLEQPKTFKCCATLTVKNIGQGAALYTRAWCQAVTDQFVNGSMILEKTLHSQESNGFSHLLPSESASIVITGLNPEIVGQRRIVVIEAIDATSIRHQLQIVMTPVAPGQSVTEVAMVHADLKQFRKSAQASVRRRSK